MVCASPPTIVTSSPRAATAWPPLTGASRTRRPYLAASSAISRTSRGATVLCTAITAPRGIARAARVGFIGLGNQGAPIAQRIADGGFDSVVWARRAEALEPFRGGPARIARTLTELGEGLDLLDTCVFEPATSDLAGSNPLGLSSKGSSSG
jgi:hypothetical protein